MFWAEHSWPYFFRHEDAAFFAWRTYWGQRLVLDLTHVALIPDDGPAIATLTRVMDEEEKRLAQGLLSELTGQLDEVKRFLAQRDSSAEDEKPHPLRARLQRAVAALHLVGVHRIEACLPLLRRWEAIEYRAYSIGSSAFASSHMWWMNVQAFRPILHHSLRLLGAQPQGYACYHFRINGQAQLLVPEQVTGRRARAVDLDPSMSAEQVLQWMGSPDHIQRRSYPVGTLFRSTEEWEYDFQVADQWVTLRITWEQHKKQSRIATIEEVPASWLQTDERVLEILSH